MLIRWLFLMKMKRCYLIVILSCLLLSIVYFNKKIRKSPPPQLDEKLAALLPNYNVHIFYDARFKNKRVDGKYKNWNYENIDVAERIASAYYPELGLYSCNSFSVIDQHMKQIKDAGIGVVVVSWWPKQYETSPPMDLILNYAIKYDLKVTIQIQNYNGRNIVTLKRSLYYFFKNYREHPALYKTVTRNSPKPLPLIYIYDSYLIPVKQWNILLGYTGNYTVRGTNLDAIYIGLLVDEVQQYLILNADFDGFYTYFAVNNSTYGSSWFQWPYIQDFARERDVIFIPTVGPGYSDKSELPQPNKSKAKLYAKRNYGAYYIRSWMRAIISRSKFVSINSFNGWQMGTQIEPAVPKEVKVRGKTYTYADYQPESPDYYLTVTRSWVIDFTNRSTYRTI